MIKIIAISILIIVMSCTTNKEQALNVAANIDDEVSNPAYEASLYENLAPKLEPYRVNLYMQKLETDVYDFVISMQLYGGSYYVSPNAVRDFKGKFTIYMDDNQELETMSDLIETPPSVEEFDPHPFVNGKVNWVTKDTKYSRKYKLTAQKDFEVMGYIQFTIEPRCTLEKIPFVIKFKDGEITVGVPGC